MPHELNGEEEFEEDEADDDEWLFINEPLISPSKKDKIEPGSGSRRSRGRSPNKSI